MDLSCDVGADSARLAMASQRRMLLADKRPVRGFDEAADHGRKITPPAVADRHADTDGAHLVAASTAVKEVLYLCGEDRVDVGDLSHIDGSIDRSAPEFIVAKLAQRLEYALGYALQVFLVHFCDPIRANACPLSTEAMVSSKRGSTQVPKRCHITSRPLANSGSGATVAAYACRPAAVLAATGVTESPSCAEARSAGAASGPVICWFGAAMPRRRWHEAGTLG